jgi:hypothetical protein
MKQPFTQQQEADLIGKTVRLKGDHVWAGHKGKVTEFVVMDKLRVARVDFSAGAGALVRHPGQCEVIDG